MPGWFCLLFADKADLELLKWAIAHGYTLTSKVILNAVQKKNIELMKWAVENGCPWPDDICTSIVEMRYEQGNSDKEREVIMEMFEWAVLHGGTPTSKTWTVAASKGDLELIRWAKEHESASAMNLDLKLLVWDAIDTAQLALVKWFVKQGAILDSLALTAVARHQSIKVLTWLRQKKRIPLTKEVTKMAQNHRNEALFYWLVGLIPPVDPKREAKEKAKDESPEKQKISRGFLNVILSQ